MNLVLAREKEKKEEKRKQPGSSVTSDLVLQNRLALLSLYPVPRNQHIPPNHSLTVGVLLARLAAGVVSALFSEIFSNLPALTRGVITVSLAW